MPVCVRERTGRHRTRNENGSDESAPYLKKHYFIRKKVLSFELTTNDSTFRKQLVFSFLKFQEINKKRLR